MQKAFTGVKYSAEVKHLPARNFHFKIMMELELVLPCYNESKSLNALVRRVVLAAEEFKFSSAQFQLVLVENGSGDDSFSVMSRLKDSPLGNWFRIVKIEQNQGYGFGLHSGLKTTSAKFVAYSHADMQCDPRNVFVALDCLKEKQLKESNWKWVVKGYRHDRNWKDRLVSRVFETFSFLFLGLKLVEINAQPKVFPRELLSEIVEPPSTFAFDLYFLFRAKKANYNIEIVPVKFPPRLHGVSNWASSFLSRYKTIGGIIRYMFDLSRREGRL